jgi:hypothetical protein
MNDTLCENDLSQKWEAKDLKNTKQPLRKMLRGGCYRKSQSPEVPEIKGFSSKKEGR